MTTSTQSKPQRQKYIDVNPVESLKGVGREVATVASDETQKSMKEFWEQVLGAGKYKTKPHSREMKAGESYSIAQDKQKASNEEHIRPGMDYHREIREAGERTSVRVSQEIRQQIQQIMGEIARIASTSTTLEKAFTSAKGQAIVNPGKNQLNFFEWLLIELRQARMQIESAGSWLATMSSKNGKKQGKSQDTFWSKVESKNGGSQYLISC